MFMPQCMNIDHINTFIAHTLTKWYLQVHISCFFNANERKYMEYHYLQYKDLEVEQWNSPYVVLFCHGLFMIKMYTRGDQCFESISWLWNTLILGNNKFVLTITKVTKSIWINRLKIIILWCIKFILNIFVHMSMIFYSP